MRAGMSYLANRYVMQTTNTWKIMIKKPRNISCIYQVGGFKWMIKEKTEKLNLSKYTEDSKEGLMLVVDPDYPQELHNILYNNHTLTT